MDSRLNNDDIPGLQDTLDVLVAAFNPIRIVLFGSQARGDAVASSDIDVLVVLDNMTHKRNALGAMLEAVSVVDANVDPIPTDLDEIERRGDMPGDILRSALRDGRVVYERAA
ncbi:MAG: nucleotidyltransferase domain-containing protein [Actinomycetia bacterium]|nr:nucleotidyltransferase domain-containing protein [Actinomycetes bacterium]